MHTFHFKHALKDMLQTENTTAATLILGVGNILLGDEGVGIHIIKKLEQMNLGSDVAILDGGTGGFHLLSELQGYPNIVMLDASLDDFPEGHVRCLKPKYSKDFPRSLSAHDVGLKDLLDAMVLLESMPDITLITISIKDLNNLSVDLTPSVEKAADKALNVVLELLNNDK